MTNITQSAFVRRSAVVLPPTPVTVAVATPIIGQPHVYVLPTLDRTCLKIGRSSDPLDRIASLANIYPNIDLSRSVIVGVDTHRVETVTHTVFSQRRMTLNKRSDGFTEWFAGDFLEEVLELIQRVARHRGVEYPVFENVDRLLTKYRAHNPNAGKRAPRQTQAEILTRKPLIEARLSELALEHTQRFIDVLSDREFDAVIEASGTCYLARNVSRSQEPECWQQDKHCHCSDWGRQLAEHAHIHAQVEGGSCSFRLVKPPVFLPVDDKRGHEYFRISETRPLSPGHGSSLPSVTDAAFVELWGVLDQLRKVEAQVDPLRPDENSSYTGC